jgi:hypothetical protein
VVTTKQQNNKTTKQQYKIVLNNLKRRDHSGDIVIDGRLKWDFKTSRQREIGPSKGLL